MVKLFKIGLAILLLLCLADMPYGYFQFVRFISLVGFGLFAYQAIEQGKQSEAIIYVVLALLFQPFFKISLGRTLWNIVDVFIAVGLLLSVFSATKEKEK